MYVAFVFHRQTAWIRTERTPATPQIGGMVLHRVPLLASTSNAILVQKRVDEVLERITGGNGFTPPLANIDAPPSSNGLLLYTPAPGM